jgi:hypothetical protein
MFVVVYFDDILIYSRTESKLSYNIRQVLQVLRDNKVYGNLEKCTFCKDKVIFLGYIVMRTSLLHNHLHILLMIQLLLLKTSPMMIS